MSTRKQYIFTLNSLPDVVNEYTGLGRGTSDDGLPATPVRRLTPSALVYLLKGSTEEGVGQLQFARDRLLREIDEIDTVLSGEISTMTTLSEELVHSYLEDLINSIDTGWKVEYQNEILTLEHLEDGD